MQDRIAYQGMTFDDVLLEPGFSELLPKQVEVKTHLTANIPLDIPILSSPMDTVTEAELAIALAQEGGLGVIHKNMTVEQQAREVDKVKRSENGIIVDPVTLPPDAMVGKAREIMAGHNISGVPITVDGKLKGILTAPRPAVSGVGRPAGRGRDDQGEPRHRSGEHEPGRSRADFDEK